MDMTVISGTISGLKTASDLVKSVISANTMVEVNSKALELQRALLSAYADAISAKETQSALLDEIRELKGQLSKNEEFVADMKRYKLYQPDSTATVYALKESMSNGEPPHYLCANCYQSKRKTILQVLDQPGGWQYFTCPSCKSAAPTGHRGGTKPKFPPEESPS
jgi:hypothetical protein